MVNRVLTRVTVPLLIMESALLAGWIIQEIQTLDTSSRFNIMKVSGVITLLGLCGLMGTVINMENTGKEYDMRLEADARWNTLTEYCSHNPKQYYSIDVYSSTSYQGTPYADKIFAASDNQYTNYDICGGWIAKSPLTRAKQERAGFKGLEEALLTGQVLFVAKPDSDVSWLSAYYQNRGKTVEPKVTDEVKTADGETIYLIYQLQ